MAKYTIAIDAGHHPNSANGGSQGYREGKGMMTLALLLYKELKKYPEIKPVLTRTEADDKNPDNVVSLAERSRRAAVAGAFALFSLHTNAAGTAAAGTAGGAEVFYSLKHPGDKKLAANLSAGIADALGIKDRGAKTRPYPGTTTTDYYSIIRETIKQGVRHAFLIEHAFHDNPREERLLMDADNLKAIAKVEAAHIAVWLGVADQPEGQPKPQPPKPQEPQKPQQPETDNTPAKWAEASVRKAINKDILIGDENGDYKLHSPTTREELMVFLDRAGLL